jgi:rhodanese-related sulfurtransferase
MKKIMRGFIWLLVFLMAGCTYLRPKQNSMSNLTQNEWAEQLAAHPQAVVLDVRTEEEFESGYIPNAQNIDLRMGQGFIDALQELNKEQTYFVYCRSGARSAQACQLMSQLGFTTTYNLMGGILEWEGEVVD